MIHAQLEQARLNFLHSPEVLDLPVFYCKYCNRQLLPFEVTEHVRTSSHTIAKDESENIPSHGCPIVLHGRPLLLDHHVIFVDTMFGKNVMLFDDTIGAIVLPDITLGVQLCPGHEYSLVKFRMVQHSSPDDAVPSAENTLPSDTAQNRYFTRDFANVDSMFGLASKVKGPKDSFVNEKNSKDARRLAVKYLGLTDGDDLPNSRNAAVLKKLIRLRRRVKILKERNLKNRALKIRDDEDTTFLRFPKNVSNFGGGTSSQKTIVGVLPLAPVERQENKTSTRNRIVRNKLIHKLARVALMEAKNSNKKRK